MPVTMPVNMFSCKRYPSRQIVPGVLADPSSPTHTVAASPTDPNSARKGTTDTMPCENAQASEPTGSVSSGGNSNGPIFGENWNLSCWGAASGRAFCVGVDTGVGSAAGPAEAVADCCGEMGVDE